MTNEVNSKSEVVASALETGKPRPRGNFWEITYKENTATFPPRPLSKDADLSTVTGITEVLVTTEEETRGLKISKKQFVTCDFNHFTLADSTFADCTFTDCLFVKSNFQGVKFSRCHFESCHFSSRVLSGVSLLNARLKVFQLRLSTFAFLKLPYQLPRS